MTRSEKRQGCAAWTAVGLCFLMVWLCLTYVGCTPCQYCSKHCPPVESTKETIIQHDTTYIEIRVQDTVQVVKLVQETVVVSAPVTDTVHGETAYTKGTAYVNPANRIVLHMENKDSAEVLVQTIQILQKQISDLQHTIETTEVKTEYRTKGFVKFLAWVGGIGLLLALIWLVWTIAKAYIKKG